MAHCDYWWFAGNVEWCDLMSTSCRCGGWEDSCALKKRRKKAERRMDMHLLLEDDDIRTNHRRNYSHG